MSDTERPELTIKEAAKACGVSDKTIRRNLDKFPNAHRLDAPSGPQAGPWVIPVPDLIAAGYKPGTPAPPDEPTKPAPPRRAGTADDELRKRVDTLEAEARDAREKLTAADHRAELDAQTINAVRAELDHLQALHAKDIDKLESDNKRLTAERDRDNKRLTAERDRARSDLEQRGAELDRQRTRADRAEGASEKLTEHRDELSKRLDRLEAAQSPPETPEPVSAPDTPAETPQALTEQATGWFRRTFRR